VKILPMHSARGLQFRIVLLLWADLLPSPFKSRDDGPINQTYERWHSMPRGFS
jgi:hypothetical protein